MKQKKSKNDFSCEPIISTTACIMKLQKFIIQADVFRNELKIKYSLPQPHNPINHNLYMRIVFIVNNKVIHSSKEFYLCDVIKELSRGFMFVKKVTSNMVFNKTISCDIKFEYNTQVWGVSNKNKVYNFLINV